MVENLVYIYREENQIFALSTHTLTKSEKYSPLFLSNPPPPPPSSIATISCFHSIDSSTTKVKPQESHTSMVLGFEISLVLFEFFLPHDSEIRFSYGWMVACGILSVVDVF